MLSSILDNDQRNRFAWANSILVYSLQNIFFFLLHMATFGDTGAKALKEGINNIFA